MSVEESSIRDELGIRRTLATYCHLCDDGDFTALAELFAPEGAFVYRGEVVGGRPALARWFEAMQGQPSQQGRHLTVNTVVDQQGERARALSDFLFVRSVDGALTPAVVGRYHDDLVRLGDRWLFVRREALPFAPRAS